MRNPLALLFKRSAPKADPRVVTALETYIRSLCDVLRENTRAYRISVQADIDAVQGPVYMTATLSPNVTLSLHATTYSAVDYYAALKEVTLPEGVEMQDLKYNRRAETVVCTLDGLDMLRALKREMSQLEN